MSDSKESIGAKLSRSQEMLLAFLSEHDAACPVCGYNVRALTRPVCPECRQELELTVGAARPPLGWLLAAVAPGFFSGMSALFLLVPIVGQIVFGGFISPTLIVLDLFGWCSGALAIIIARRRIRFIAQPIARQQRWTALIWLVHITALVLLVLFGPAYL